MISKIIAIAFLLTAYSCLPTVNQGDAQCSGNYAYNPATRACDRPINQVSDPTLSYITIGEDSGANTVTLSYADGEDDRATSCSILTYTDGINDIAPTACSCDAFGVCTVIITPDYNFYGNAQFSYNVVDQDGTSKNKAVYVVVEPVNDSPVASNGSYSTDEITVIYDGNLSSLVTDPDIGESFTYSIVNYPSNGEIINFNSATGVFAFVPYDDDTLHQDDVATMGYKVCDDEGACDIGVITFTVTDVNNAPTITLTQPLTLVEGTLKNFNLNSAVDVEGDTLSYTILTEPSWGTLSGDCKDIYGINCNYTPNDSSYYGLDSFTYKVCDLYSACSEIVTVNVTITDFNDAPTVGADQTLSVVEDDAVTFTLNPGSDEESGGVDSSYTQLSYHDVVSGPSNGTLSGCVLVGGGNGGSCTYTPAENFNGTDSFTYKVSDGHSYSSTAATVSITVTPDNDAPEIDEIARVQLAEGSQGMTGGFRIDEGGSLYEDSQEIRITLSVSNPVSSTILDVADLELYYNVSGAPALVGTGAGPFLLSDNGVWANDSSESSNGYQFFVGVTALAGGTGTAMVTITVDDGSGEADSSASKSFEVYVPELSAKHTGWQHVSAIGKKVDKDGNELTAHNRVYLQWHQFTLAGMGEAQGATIKGWNIYRRQFGQTYDDEPNNPLNGTELISSTQLYYADESVDSNKVYYYKVIPVDSIFEYGVPTGEPYSEVRVVSPPQNMAFVHRWMVNQEVCEKMHLTVTTGDIEKTNNFRCPYKGPGDDVDRDGVSDGYYDIGYDMLVDLSEAGCPYSSASAAPECGVNGCIGIGTPTSKGIVPGALDKVYYDRHSGTCYQSNGTASAANWEEFNGAAYDSVTADNSKKALLPPLVMINQQSAYTFCNSRNDLDGTISGISGALSFDLPTRKEQIAYSAWNDLANVGLEDSVISELEIGAEIDNNSKCNSSSASGLTVGYTAVEIPASSFGYAITGTDSSGIRSIYTGSEALGSNALTPACVSRYGVQDPYGNVAEWVQDQISCSDGGGSFFTCSQGGLVGNAAFSDWVVSDPFFVEYALDGQTGPCVNAPSCSSALSGWYFEDDNGSNLGKRLVVPLAIPVSTQFEVREPSSGVIPYLMAIGNNSGISDSKLHDDYFGVNAADIIAAAEEGGMIVGGSYLSTDKSGRYTGEFKPVSTQTPDIGFRCVIPISSASYDNDLLHTYSY